MKNSLYCFLIIALAIPFLTSCVEKEKPGIAVYKVTQSGATRESAEKLIKLLPIDEALLKDGRFIDSNGRIAIIDTNRHLSVPTKILGKEKNDEDGQTVTAEALDIEKLKTIKAIAPEVAQASFLGALKESDLLPAQGEVRTKNNWLKVVDQKGNIISNTAISTRVTFDIHIDEFPVEGPGAKVSASFSGDGAVTQLKHANRKLSKGKMVTLLDSDKVKERCKEMYDRSAPKGGYQELNIKTRLFYYSPPLSQKGVHTLIPYYECTGSATIDKQRISLLQRSIPATDDKKYVPAITLKVLLNGSEVVATANIEGGSPPYEIRWNSPSIGSKEGDTTLKYELARRNKEMHEVLVLDVIDDNGVFVQASHMVKFDQAALPQLFDFPSIKVGGVRDYGTENSVYNEFGGLDQGFIDQMNADGAIRRFSWRGLAAWEQDFKEPEDSQWIDNTDIAFFVGHGNVGYFTFEDNTHDDSRLDNNDATGDWGDKDLEWLALYSCQVMGKGGDGQEPFRNWKQEFDGLHLLLGFHTNARVSNQFSGKFASNMLSSNTTVRYAWFDAIDDHQPNDREGVIMGVFRASDNAWNYNDHFHGKGSVGPDIRGSNIGLGWYVTGP